jgi:lipopolysaccharide/colanic/teichoic acid biosynthesis glycosyltransferase/GGDEF domain-containing protein
MSSELSAAVDGVDGVHIDYSAASGGSSQTSSRANPPAPSSPRVQHRRAGELAAPSLPGIAEHRSLHHVYGRRQMAFVLQRERARADRHHRSFALLLLMVDHRDPLAGPDRTMLRLAKAALKLARSTDEVGCLDSNTLAIVLPDTSANGAANLHRRLLHIVHGHWRWRGAHLSAEVHSYPEETAHANGNGNANGNGHANGNGNGNGHSLDLNDAFKLSTRNSKSPAARNLMPFVIKGMADELGRGEVPASGKLHLMFASPLPWWKRAIDLVFASLLLMVLTPLLLVIAMLIKLTSRGPVVFTQRRAGLAGRPFTIYKFRTMRSDAEVLKAQLKAMSEQDGPAFKIHRDPRITRIGKILRETSLDELPQLWNVIKGDMSLVGPRPLPVDEQDECALWQRRRLDVTPGLTCIWQVEGRSRVTFDEWVRMDLKYIRKRRLTHDLAILFKTIPAVLLRKGAR